MPPTCFPRRKRPPACCTWIRGSAAADLAGGNRELLQTLAIEASTVLENARLLEEERTKQEIEEELDLARAIQQSLLPRSLPAEGWLRAAGSSVASHAVGGDYFDVTEVNPGLLVGRGGGCFGQGRGFGAAGVVARRRVAGRHRPARGPRPRIERLNRFLIGRTGGEKYATRVLLPAGRDGRLGYVNAAHCPPLVVRPGGKMDALDATAMPVGLMEGAEFPIAEARLAPGDKLVVYTDGVTEAQNLAGEFFGKRRLKDIVAEHAAHSCAALHDAIQQGVAAFTEGAPQADDITVLVVELGAERDPRWDRRSVFVVCQFAFEFQPENDRPRNAMVCPTSEVGQTIGFCRLSVCVRVPA